jgi:hypothetical protein
VEKALSQVRALYKAEGKYETPASSATASWGYSIKSSGGRQTLATLKYYGLIDVSGDGDNRKVKVSSTALDILLDTREDETEKKKLIRKVALTPPVHKALLDTYPDGLASDGTVTHYLVKTLGYSPDAAREVLAEFKQTSAYADLYGAPVEGGETNAATNNLAESARSPIEVGSKIQWTSGGVDQLVTPATVLGLSADGAWVFIDASESAVPADEVTVVKPATATEVKPPMAPPEVLAAREALKVSALPTPTDGQTILSQGKLKSGSFEIRVTGEIGPKEIGKIIKLLEAQKQILSEDDEDEDE